MRFYRIGDKLVSRDKLADAIEAVLLDRQSGATQEEAARHAGVQRSFVSFLETLGEVRRGPKVALLAFPVANADDVKSLADKYAVDFALVLSQQQRESIENAGGSAVFNQLLDTIALLREFDTVILLASDLRIATIEKILGNEVIGISIGPSPLREDVVLDLDELEAMIASVMSSPAVGRWRRGRVGDALREAAEIAGRWTQSKRL